MKIRTSLVAATTAAAVMTSGAAVATAAPVVNNADGTAATEERSSNSEGSSIDNISPQEIRDWIAVVTAIVGMITQILTLVNKFKR